MCKKHFKKGRNIFLYFPVVALMIFILTFKRLYSKKLFFNLMMRLSFNFLCAQWVVKWKPLTTAITSFLYIGATWNYWACLFFFIFSYSLIHNCLGRIWKRSYTNIYVHTYTHSIKHTHYLFGRDILSVHFTLKIHHGLSIQKVIQN